MQINRPYEVNYTIEDGKGSKSVMTVYVWRRDQYTDPLIFEGHRDPEQFALELGSAIDKIIKGKIKRITIGTVLRDEDFPFPPSHTFKPFADPNSDVEEGITVTYKTVQGYIFKHRIPTIDEAVINADGELDLSNVASDQTYFIHLMLTPSETSADWEVYPTDHRNTDLWDYVGSGDAFDASRANKRR